MEYASYYIGDSLYDNGAGKAARKAKNAQKKADRAAQKGTKEGTWLSRTIDNVKRIADGTTAVAGSVSSVAGMFSKQGDTTVSGPASFEVVDPSAEPKFLGMPKTIGIMVTALVSLMILGTIIFLIFRKKK